MALTDSYIPAETIRLRQEDRATMDFIKNVKTVSSAVVGSSARRQYAATVAGRKANGQAVPSTIREIGEVINPLFPWQADRFISRQAQEMLWPRLFEALEPREEQFLAWYNTAVPGAKGSLTLNPELVYPSWYEVDFHVQPGGFHKEALIPFVMEIGQAVYHSGNNDKWGIQYRTAAGVPAGVYERVLDMGSSFGHSSIALAERFPGAQVFAIDMSAPMLKYAHQFAEQQGFPIHYSQQNAERTTFPDAFFDTVSSCIIFHEMPDAAAVNVIREAYRILKPGGWFVIGDVTPYRYNEPFQAFFSDWQTENNGEPYWRQAGNRDYPALFRAAGFRDIEEPAFDYGSGNKNPWITRGRK